MKTVRVGFLAAFCQLVNCQVLNDLDRTGGNSEKGYFEISPSANLAKGAKLEFTLGDYETLSGTEGNIGLEEPSADDSDIANIVSYDESGLIELKGVSAGETRIGFTAQADEQTIKDGFSVRVVNVTDLKFLPCATNGAYVRGEQTKIGYRFNESAAKDVLGLGYYPFTTSPSAGLSLDKGASTTTYFSLFVEDAAASLLTIRSTLAGDDSALKLYIVAQSDIDAVAAWSSTTTDRGQYIDVDLRPLVNGRPICSNVRRVLRSLNPYACSIKGAVNGELDTTDLKATISLDAVDVCLLTLEFPDANKVFDLGSFIVTEPYSSSSGSY